MCLFTRGVGNGCSLGKLDEQLEVAIFGGGEAEGLQWSRTLRNSL